MSWTLGGHKEGPIESNEMKLEYMKIAAKDLYPALRIAIQDIPSDVTVLDIKLQD